jgi:DNA-binding NtrC family response regulator
MTALKVLIVEDEPNTRSGLAELVTGWGYRVDTAKDGVEGLERALAWDPAIIVTDLKMPRLDGFELIERLRDARTTAVIIVVTAQGSIESAVDAMRLGAYDFVQKPIDPTRLKTTLNNAGRQLSTQRELEVTRRKLRDVGVLGPLVGSSQKMQQIFGMIENIAPSNVAVLITGESGTGKELVARTLHQLSPRANKAFVAVNCAAIPETLIESEIFGHEKGAFTGAVERRLGCFELAEEGTLLLDEIGEMPIATQAKLLRVLEDRKLRRLGSKAESAVDVRVVAATNKDPQTAIADGHMRGDLFYRLNVFNIHMPPLRDHMEDIPELVDSMIADMNQRHQRRTTGVSAAVMDKLCHYDWPGNVRELRNTIERGVILAGEGELGVQHLPPGFGRNATHSTGAELAHDPSAGDNPVVLAVGTTVEEGERRLILRTLQSTGGNKTRAAEVLRISLKTLHNKLKEYSGASVQQETAAEPDPSHRG